jgi:fructokinase
MKRGFVVAGIGELLWDFLPTGKQLGGAPGNFAFHAMQTGCTSLVISAVGNDELGCLLKSLLQRLGLNIEYLQQNDYPTGTVTVKLDKSGHPDYTIHENVAWDHICWNMEMQKLAGQLDAVCFGTLAQRNTESELSIRNLLRAVKPECLKVFDVNLRQNYYSGEVITNSLQFTDILKLNEDELPVISGLLGINGSIEIQLDELQRLFKLKYIIYTMGSNGSYIKNADELSYEEVPEIEISDTVGAGDSFTAIVIAGILNKIPLKVLHKKATEIAAYVCTQKGATPKLEMNIF